MGKVVMVDGGMFTAEDIVRRVGEGVWTGELARRAMRMVRDPETLAGLLAGMPEGSYSVAWYRGGQRAVGCDSGVSLAYVEGAARDLGTEEGIVAVCESDLRRPSLRWGWVGE